MARQEGVANLREEGGLGWVKVGKRKGCGEGRGKFFGGEVKRWIVVEERERERLGKWAGKRLGSIKR